MPVVVGPLAACRLAVLLIRTLRDKIFSTAIAFANPRRSRPTRKLLGEVDVDRA
jgi:hypothetical protein